MRSRGDLEDMDPTREPEAAGAQRPVSYRLITPLEWFRIPLASEEARNRSVRVLVDRTFPNRDQDTVRRREFAELIGNLAWESAVKDGLELYLSTQAVLGVPVPAALVVTVEAPDEPGSSLQAPPAVLAEAQQREYPGAEVGVVSLAAGQSVRVRRSEVPAHAEELGAPQGRTSTLLTHIVPVPDTGALLVLSFSTPLEELADALVEVFDAIAGSLRWQE
ncbi:hypothetical protein [Streptomyces sp. YIM 98790]|uniref:hypothetical protein n=1 Tax=Streptomyces sp. YIM 98790 TaxID=2689077 RepID=UPI001408D194|nr:hypothetical protein [Streptomyces sp. YIM 98790]